MAGGEVFDRDPREADVVEEDEDFEIETEDACLGLRAWRLDAAGTGGGERSIEEHRMALNGYDERGPVWDSDLGVSPDLAGGLRAASMISASKIQRVILPWLCSRKRELLSVISPKRTGKTACGVVASLHSMWVAKAGEGLKVVYIAASTGLAEKTHEMAKEVARLRKRPVRMMTIGMSDEIEPEEAEILFGTTTSFRGLMEKNVIDTMSVELCVVDDLPAGLLSPALDVLVRLPPLVRTLLLASEGSHEFNRFVEEAGVDAFMLEASQNPGAAPLATVSESEARQAKEQGNQLYKSGEFLSSIEQYSVALRSKDVLDSERAVFYSNRAAARMKLGDWRGVERDCTRALKANPANIKALLRRKSAREELGNLRGAVDDAKELQEKSECTSTEVNRLEVKRAEKEKKDTEEAMGKLKDLGNSLLGSFGLSLDNFKMDKDPNSGGYNIRFEK